MDRKKKQKLVLNIIFIAIFFILVVIATIKYGPYLVRIARKPEQLKELLNSYGWKGILVFILFQVVQVIVAAIPGEFIQISGGFIYGTWLGTLYSFIGILSGSFISFYISRLLGYSLIRTFVSKKSLEKFDFVINNDKSEIVMFLLFVIPGIPKDILTYIAGLTPIKPIRFFIMLIIARFPALLASSYIGYNTQKGNYVIVIILSVITLILFTVGLLYKDKIIEKIHKLGRPKE